MIMALTALVGWTDDLPDGISKELQKQTHEAACSIMRTDLLKIRDAETTRAQKLLAPTVNKIQGLLKKFGQRLRTGREHNYLSYYDLADLSLESALGTLKESERCMDNAACAKVLRPMEKILGPDFNWIQKQSHKITCPKGMSAKSTAVFDRGFAQCLNERDEAVLADGTMWLSSSREELEPPMICAQIKIEPNAGVQAEFYRACVNFNIENPNDVSAVTYHYVGFDESDDDAAQSQSFENDFDEEYAYLRRLAIIRNDDSLKACFAPDKYVDAELVEIEAEEAPSEAAPAVEVSEQVEIKEMPVSEPIATPEPSIVEELLPLPSPQN